MTRIVTKTTEEFNKELIEETARRTAEGIKKTLEESSHVPSESKVSQILRNANKGQISLQTNEGKDLKSELDQEKEKLEEIKRKERQNLEKEKEELEKRLEETELFCPTCTSKEHKHEDSHEHKHKLKKIDNGLLKCTGDGCKTEYALIPKDADYKCTNCGSAHKKPIEINDDDDCPMCGNKDFLKYDWSKVIKKKEK